MDKDLTEKLKELIKKAKLPVSETCEDNSQINEVGEREPLNKDYDDKTKERFLNEKLKLENDKLALENKNLSQSIDFRRDLTFNLQRFTIGWMVFLGFMYPEEVSFMHDAVYNMMFDKMKALEAFTYSNLETEVLQAMKLNIENELMMRGL